MRAWSGEGRGGGHGLVRGEVEGMVRMRAWSGEGRGGGHGLVRGEVEGMVW